CAETSAGRHGPNPRTASGPSPGAAHPATRPRTTAATAERNARIPGFSIAPPGKSRGAGSEGVLQGQVVEVAVRVSPGLADEVAGEEVAVARVAEGVGGEVVPGVEVGLGAAVAGPGARAGPQHRPALVVERVSIRGPPEEVLLQREGQVADRRDADAGARAHD